MKTKLTAFMVFTTLLLQGCFNGSQNSESESLQYLAGPIDEAFQDRFDAKLGKSDRLIFISTGGKVDIAMSIAERMIAENQKVGTRELCLSSCAEFLLLAGDDIVAIDKPLIGYHQSPLFLKHLKVQYSERDLEFCNYERAKRHSGLLRQSQKGELAWRATLEKLNLRDYKAVYGDGTCPKSKRNFEYSLWFPTKRQLEDIFGLRIKGDICADDPSCYEERLPIYLGVGKRVLVGHTPFDT